MDPRFSGSLHGGEVPFFKNRVLIIAFLCICLLLMKHDRLESAESKKEKTPSVKELPSIGGLKLAGKELDKPLLIFSSRFYVPEITALNPEVSSVIYWVIPDKELTLEKVAFFEKFLKDLKKTTDIELATEGLVAKWEKVTFYVVPLENLRAVSDEDYVMVADVDFFFRLNTKEFPNPRVSNVIKFFRTLSEHNITINSLWIIKSLDINLPVWVQEFSYYIRHVYINWINDIFPSELAAMDEADNLINGGSPEKALDLLYHIEEKIKDNPVIYSKMLITAIRTLHLDEAFELFEKGYLLEPGIISLLTDGAEFIIEKEKAYYGAFALAKYAMEKEPWNKALKETFEQVVERGYNYYNLHEGNDKLFEFFKKEKDKLTKTPRRLP